LAITTLCLILDTRIRQILAAQRHHIASACLKNLVHPLGLDELLLAIGNALIVALELPRRVAGWDPVASRAIPKRGIDSSIGRVLVLGDTQLRRVEFLRTDLHLEQLIHELCKPGAQASDLVGRDLEWSWTHIAPFSPLPGRSTTDWRGAKDTS
jgi:hypothetical protein